MRFSVVIPVYNEADNIPALLAEIDTVLASAGDYEVIVVDDGSDDGSADQLAQARLQKSALRILRHAQRCGQSAALVTGVRAARAPLVVTLDGDGQNDPADIPRLLACYAQQGGGQLLLAGHRLDRKDSGLTRLASRLANAVRAFFLKDETPDSACGLKLFPRDLFLLLPAFDHMHRFLPALARRQGARSLSIDVHTRPRRHGRSKYGINNRLWVGIVDLFGVLWLQRRRIVPSVTELD